MKYTILNVFMGVSFVFTTMLPAQTANITVDATAAGEPLNPVWNYFGYDECNYTTTAAGKDLLKTLGSMSKEKPYIRMHHLLNTTSGAPGLKWGSTDVYTEDSSGKPVYYWKTMDSIMDVVIESRCLPLVEIGFMPKALTSAPDVPYRKQGCSVPPDDYNKWAGLISEWATHSKARYQNVESTWLWELWNEPNISYWRGSKDDYIKLFDYTEVALHKVLPGAVLGGPHSAGPNFDWINSLMSHSETGTNASSGQKGTRLGYVGFHQKGGVAVVNGHVQMNLGNQLKGHQSGFNTVHASSTFKDLPIIIGEADPDGCAACPASTTPANAYRNVPAYGAYEVAMMKHSLDLAKKTGINLKGLVTWAFEFEGQPYFEGYRTLSTNGIHKPVLNAFKMIAKLNGTRIPVLSSAALGLDSIVAKGVRNQPDIDGLAAKEGNKIVRVLIWNYHDDIVSVAPAQVNLTVQLPAGFSSSARVTHYRMDDTHSNAYTKWLELGKPQNPTAEQISQLKTAMQLEMLEPMKTVSVQNNKVNLSFTLPRHGVSLVEITD